IVMENPNHLNELNEAIPEVNPVVPEPNQVVDIHDSNEMVDIPDDFDLVDYDEEDPEEVPKEDPEEDPDEKPKEDVDIELEDDVELIRVETMFKLRSLFNVQVQRIENKAKCGPTMVNGGPPPLTVVDRRSLPLTADVDRPLTGADVDATSWRLANEALPRGGGAAFSD
ncbi:hypothetical protein Tco_1559804, partial [Tanacetum coccineum]